MLALLALMSLALGISSFACGILPLSFVFSKNHLDRLSALGTGLLLGAALGVIIPEGIETVVTARPSNPPTLEIALSLLSGFTLMLVIEQLISPHSHSHSHSQNSSLALHTVKPDLHPIPSQIEFDAELGDIEHEESMGHAAYMQPTTPALVPTNETAGSISRAFPLTFGLVIHGLADGLALGTSALATNKSGESSRLSLIVFLALIIHKAPTSLALTTSLLATSLPRTQCKKYLAVFSTSTPVGAITSYLTLSFLGAGDGGWTGAALLVSGGTFLYVATVLQPVSGHPGSPATGDMRPVIRVLHITIGMFVPFILSALLGHGH